MKAERGEQPLHRDGKSTLKKREKKKLLAKTNWYKTGKKEENNDTECKGQKGRKGSGKNKQRIQENEIQPSAVIFVPRTPHGELATRLREVETEMQKVGKTKVKIVEESGDMAKSLVHKANQWAGDNCQREKCLVCKDGGRNGDCRRRNVTYLTWCRRCKEKGKDSQYLGETSRTGFERGIEHEGDRRAEKEDTHMIEHILQEHPDTEKGEEVFSMKILRGHRSALTRQVNEAVIIANSWSKNILNSKQEYNRCVIPKLAVMMGTRSPGETGGVYNPGELLEMEEIRDKKSRKREIKQEGGRAPKRRRRWKQEVKSAGEKRYAGEEARTKTDNPCKRRRIDSWAAPFASKKSLRQVSMGAYITRKWQKVTAVQPEPEKADPSSAPSSSSNSPRKTPLPENEHEKDCRANFAARKTPVTTSIAKKDQEMSAKFESVLKMFRKIEEKEKCQEISPKSEENARKKEQNLIQEKEKRKIPESVKTPKKILVKPKNALSGSKNHQRFTGSGLGMSQSSRFKLSNKKTPKKRSVAAKPFERGKSKSLEYGNVRKITTFFERKEPSKFSKLSLGGEVHEHTAKSNLKDGAKCGNETGLKQLGSHSTNYLHIVGRDTQTGTPASTEDYRVGPDTQTEGTVKVKTSTNMIWGEGPN